MSKLSESTEDAIIQSAMYVTIIMPVVQCQFQNSNPLHNNQKGN